MLQNWLTAFIKIHILWNVIRVIILIHFGAVWKTCDVLSQKKGFEIFIIYRAWISPHIFPNLCRTFAEVLQEVIRVEIKQNKNRSVWKFCGDSCGVCNWSRSSECVPCGCAEYLVFSPILYLRIILIVLLPSTTWRLHSKWCPLYFSTQWGGVVLEIFCEIGELRSRTVNERCHFSDRYRFLKRVMETGKFWQIMTLIYWKYERFKVSLRGAQPKLR